MKKFFTSVIILILILTSIQPCAFAADGITVSQVEEMLENIDTLQQMQNKRSAYSAKYHYDINTSDTNIITKHEAARAGRQFLFGVN